MSQLITIEYPSEFSAERARNLLLKMAEEYRMDVADAVVASVDNHGHLKLSQMVNHWTAGAQSGGLMGLVSGLLFLHPVVGLVAGAAVGAIGELAQDYGIKDDYMRSVAKTLRRGHAALFVQSRIEMSDQVIDHLGAKGGHIIRTDLKPANEKALIEAYDRAYVMAHE